MRNKEISQGEFQSAFLKKARDKHGNKYDYSLVVYKNNRTPIMIKCNDCNYMFNPIPFNHLSCKNCPNCGIIKQRNTTNNFLILAKEIHGERYDYTLSKYVNAKTKINIKCKKCKSQFLQLPRSHLYEKSGCPTCKLSHGESKVELTLRLLDIEYIKQHKFENCKGNGGNKLPFDFYLPKRNVCIEYDGKQHFDKTSKFWSKQIEINDGIKNEFCKTNGIILKRIPFTKFKEIEKILTFLLF